MAHAAVLDSIHLSSSQHATLQLLAQNERTGAAQEERGLHVWRMQADTDWWEDDTLHRVWPACT